jgi:CRP-like cAMP-binding protein
MGDAFRMGEANSELTAVQLRQQLKELLLQPVMGLPWDEKLAYVREYVNDLATRPAPHLASAARDPELTIVPFRAGKRPLDEALQPGSGCSEHVGLLGAQAGGEGPGGDELLLLYGLKHLDWHFMSAQAAGVDPNLDVAVSGWFVPHEGAPLTIPTLENRPVPLKVVAPTYPALDLAPASPREFLTARYVASIATEADLAGPGMPDMFGFGHQFKQRVRIELALHGGGKRLARDTTEIEVFDTRRFGSLYARLLDRLVTADTAAQAARFEQPDLHHEFHPWFPVLAIGMDKASLYLWAIRQDLELNRKHLPDPAWLLRVGLYLELLTCLGIFEAVRDDYPDLLSADERDAFERGGAFAEIRKRIDIAAWRRVWALREMAPRSTSFLAAGPVSLTNMLRKEKATLGFLHAHHEDLKHAIDLAGPNPSNAQETWHRVFRDAERAVLGKSTMAFPELRYLDPQHQPFVLWHQRGDLRIFGRYAIPGSLTSIFGDQDAILPSACRQYRSSMNDVARWARERGLMDYTGDECIPKSASLLEAYMGGDHRLLGTLQRRDGYGPTLELAERLPDDHVAPLEEIAALLRGVTVFKPLMERELSHLARRAKPAHFGPFDRVVVEGQPGSSLFVLASGTVEVLVRQSGRDVPVGTLGPGAVFGETALLTGSERSATVRALDEVVLYEIDRAAFEPVLAARPQLVTDLSLLMASRQLKDSHPTSEGLAARIQAFFFGARNA